MKAYNKYIALFLLAVISAFIVPKELVHELYEHTDTVHSWRHNSNGLPALEQEHQHCDILNFNVPIYFLSLNLFPSSDTSVAALVSEKCNNLFSSPDFRLFSHRGPPTC